VWFRDTGADDYHAALVPVGRITSVHAHGDFYDVLTVTEGVVEHRTQSERHVIGPGSAVIVRPGDSHQLSTLGAGRAEIINIAFPMRSWDAFCSLVAPSVPREWTEAPDPFVVDFEQHRWPQALDLFETTLVRFQYDTSALGLVRFLSAFIDLAERREVGTRDWPAWLAAACNDMQVEENLRLGLPRLVELCNVSSSHLVRTFQRWLGCTPIAWVTETRIAHAAHLLGTTSQPIGVISARCGFASQAYFSRVFRAQRGVTPREYRQQPSEAIVPVS
jgi:AraC family cel operon transcriptional repressor